MKVWHTYKITYGDSSVRFSVDVDAVAAAVVAVVIVFELMVGW